MAFQFYSGVNQWIDVDREFSKCQTWCENQRRPKILSRARFVNWLNRIEKPMTVKTPKPKEARDPEQERVKAEIANETPMSAEEARKNREALDKALGKFKERSQELKREKIKK